jgi:hypothetical protein
MIRLDSSQLIAGKTLVSAYAGHGVTASDIPSTGENGAGYLFNDVAAQSMLSTDQVRGEILSLPSAGVMVVNENSSFSFTDAPTGTYTATYRGFRNGVSYGDYTITLNIGNTAEFNGDVSKASVVLSQKQLSVNGGLELNSTKQALLLDSKQLSLNLGSELGVNKSLLTLAPKPLTIDVGVNLNTGKLVVNLVPKQLGLETGNSVPFEQSLIKSALAISYKQLGLEVGANISFEGNVQKSSLNVLGKQFSLNNGTELSVDTSFLNLITKPLTLTNTSVISFNEDILPLHLEVRGKLLTLDRGLVFPINVRRVFFINK